MKDSKATKDAAEPPLDCRVMRPGAGWRHIAGAVYEHTNGTRVHLLGMIRLPNGEWVSSNKWPESKDADRFVRMNGGNWKRGLMAWARAHNAELRGRPLADGPA